MNKIVAILSLLATMTLGEVARVGDHEVRRATLFSFTVDSSSALLDPVEVAEALGAEEPPPAAPASSPVVEPDLARAIDAALRPTKRAGDGSVSYLPDHLPGGIQRVEVRYALPRGLTHEDARMWQRRATRALWDAGMAPTTVGATKLMVMWRAAA